MYGRTFALAALVAAAGCGDSELAPFGRLETPVALAFHEPSGNLFIASLAGDELKVLDVSAERFLAAPAALFPLSIPTVGSPTDLAAGERFVFVLSTAEAEVGFVDTQVPAGAVGPRSVDGPDGFPVTYPLGMVPTTMASFAAAYGFAEGGTLGDHALVAGITDGGGLLVAVRPPAVDDAGEETGPTAAGLLALPELFPTTLALDPLPAPGAELVGSGGAPVEDCRVLAIGDGRDDPTHVPAIWFTRVHVGTDGAFSIDPLDEALRVEVRVPLRLADGTIEERVAPIRDLAFAPAPVSDGLLTAVAADPCALRSGRLFAVLDPSYCSGAVDCPEAAVIDLSGEAGEFGTIAIDAETGEPALYDLPSAPLDVVALAGPLDLPNAFDPASLVVDENAPLDAAPLVALFTTSEGSIYYVDGGLGSYLEAPGVRAPADAVFRVDSQEEPPGLETPVVRTDSGRRIVAAPLPTVSTEGAEPRDERWSAGFEIPIPGFSEIGAQDAGDQIPLPAGSQADILLASSDPETADRVVPRTSLDVFCEGYPIVAVAEDGSSVTVDRGALENPEGCEVEGLPLAILPPIANPWVLVGEGSSGFVGRAAAEPTPLPEGEQQPTTAVFAGDRLQFLFTPSAELVERGASFGWRTTDGFGFYSADPGVVGQLPVSVEPVLVRRPTASAGPGWRVFVAYSGTSTVLEIDPTRPAAESHEQFR